MTKIKICGLKRSTDIYFANLAKPDYIGFVFSPSKRRVERCKAAVLKEQLLPEIQAVGVFVNATVSEIIDLVQQKIIDGVQLHGDENQAYIEALREKITCPIIKAVRMQQRASFEEVLHLPVDYFLLDTYVKNGYGGTGHTFDWKMIPKIQQPFFLAGGLSVKNIEAAILQVKPFCVDISSGVETNGVKDPDKMIEIVKKVRHITDLA